MGALATVDWTIIFGYVILVIILGIILSKRAQKSMESYFVAGRKLPWWLLGWCRRLTVRFGQWQPLG